MQCHATRFHCSTSYRRGVALRKKDRLSGVLEEIGLLDALWKRRQGQLTSLCFHRIGVPADDLSSDPSLFTMSVEEFSAAMRWLRDHADVLREDELLSCLDGLTPWPKRPVCLTFDDGYIDNYSKAFPILLELNLHAWFFVAPDLLSGAATPWWDAIYQRRANGIISGAEARQLSHQIKSLPDAATQQLLSDLRSSYTATARGSFMQPEHVRVLADAGMSIGAHSMTHRVLSTLPVADQYREIITSKRSLESLTGRSVRSFAYPVGGDESYSSFTPSLVREAGFRAAFTFSDRRSQFENLDRLRLPRMAPMARHVTTKAAMVLPRIFTDHPVHL